MRTVHRTLPVLLLTLGLSATAQAAGTAHQRDQVRASKASITPASDARTIGDADVFRFRPKRR